MPGSGRTALEAGAVSVIEPGDRVLVIVAGVFGMLMREIMARVGAEVTEFAVEWGRPIDLARLEREIERVRPKAVTMVHNETSTGSYLPRRRGGPDREAPRRALPARHRLLSRRHRRAHRRVGHRSQHDGLAEVPRRAAGHVARLGGTGRVGRDGASQAQGELARVRPAALEGALDPGLPRRAGTRRAAAAPAGVHPHPPHRRPRGGDAADQGGGAWPTASAPRGGGRRLPGGPGRDAPGDVPRGLHRLRHRVLLQDARRHRARRRRHAHARPLRHPHRHRPRQDPHQHAPGRAHGHHREPALRAAHALRARVDAARSRPPHARRGRGWRRPRPSSRSRTA